ncbi:MAG: flagellar protein FlaG [Candidatus Competibacteraceae bacterium]|nr:flagellar protein FlaG [Candidatus Competibacteraceae bacterium]
MSDIGSLTSLTGSNALLSKGLSGPRAAPHEPATVQSAVAQPLTAPQSAVAQSPAGGNAEWQRRADHAQPQHPQDAAAARRQLSDTLDHLNQRLRQHDTHLQFEIDDKSQQMVVRIVDKQTQEVVRQIPSEQALALAKFFDEQEAQNSHAPPGERHPGGQESGRLKVEGWLLRATA